MAKMMLSNLAAIAQNTQNENIRMIDIDELHDSPSNFFRMDHIDELADAILGQGGVKDNLVVTPFDYITIEYLEDGNGVQPIIRIADDIPFRLNYAVRQEGTLHIGDTFTVEVSRKIDGRDLTQQDLADFLLEQGFEITQFEKEYQVTK